MAIKRQTLLRNALTHIRISMRKTDTPGAIFKGYRTLNGLANLVTILHYNWRHQLWILNRTPPKRELFYFYVAQQAISCLGCNTVEVTTSNTIRHTQTQHTKTPHTHQTHTKHTHTHTQHTHTTQTHTHTTHTHTTHTHTTHTPHTHTHTHTHIFNVCTWGMC